MMEYTVTAPLVAFVTVTAGVGKTTSLQCVHEHQSVPREGCYMLTMLTLLLIICIQAHNQTFLEEGSKSDMVTRMK